MTLPDSAKELIRSGALGHLVTTNPGGTAQVTCVWVAVEGDGLLTAHLNPSRHGPEPCAGFPRMCGPAVEP